MTEALAYLPQLLHGLWVTLQVALAALIVGMVLGILLTLAQMSRYKIINFPAATIVSLIRGLPELLVLFFIYFGGTILLTYAFGHYVPVSSFLAGVIALALIFAAYATQTLRGAMLAVPKGQLEAARALGLSAQRCFFKILLPQAWRHALPGLGNLWLVLLKDSALVSLIGLADLMNNAQLAAASTRAPFTFYLIAAVIYLLLTSISLLLIRLWQRHFRFG